jgi:YVTN family beta-propeller protein
MSVYATQNSDSSNANMRISGSWTTPNSSACARYVGRVGALAVALGVGVAVATGGTGLAWAGPDSASGSPGDSQSSGASGGDPDAPSGQGRDSENGDDSSDDDPDGDAPEMNGGSGSVDTSVDDGGQSTDTTVPTEEADDEDEIVDEVEEELTDVDEVEEELTDVDEVEEELTDDDEVKEELTDVDEVEEDLGEAEPVDTQRDSGTQGNMSSDVDRYAGRIDDEAVGHDAVHSDTDELAVRLGSGESSANRAMAALKDTADGGESRASTMSTVEERAAEPIQALMGIPATIIGMAGTFVAAVLSPFLAPRPVAPAESPLLALFAWVRREIQRTFFNRTPDAVVDTVTTSEDTDVTIDLITGADHDVHVGDVVTVTAVTQPQHGTVTVDGGTLTYSPGADFHGTDTFTYTISDEESPLHVHGLRGLIGALFGGDALHTDTVTVTVTVAPVNDDPVAVDDTFTVDEDSDFTVIDVLGNDTDADGDDLTVTGVSDTENGSAAIENGVLTYAPDGNFAGSDSFTYTVSDGNGGTATATVTVTVSPVNDAPVAVDDVAAVAEDSGPTVIDVLGNDTDPDDDDLTVAGVGDTENGSVAIENGSITYTPDADFDGTDSFTYTISDGQGGTATATVHVTVEGVNDGPVAVDDTFTVDEDSGATVIDLLGNDSDPDGDELTVESLMIGGDFEGTLSVSVETGVITYTPDPGFSGIESFTYLVGDGNGGTATATVTIDVTPVNDDPVAVDDVVEVVEDSGATVIDVLANDTDIEGDDLTVTAVGTAANGTVSLADGVVTYTPDDGFAGTDVFNYTISDGNGGTDTGTVSVTVEADDIITFDDGALPTDVFTTDDPSRIYVLTGSQLRIVDPTTGDWIDTIELGVAPWSFTMSPDQRYAYVGSGSFDIEFVPVTKIDLETGTSTLIGGVRQPTAMVVSPDGDTLYVTNYQDGTVSVIDTATGDYSAISTGLQSSAIAVSEDGSKLYVGSILNDVRVVDLDTGTYTVLATGTYDGMSIADQSITVLDDRAYVTDGVDDKLVVIDTDTDTIIASYDVGDRPSSVAVAASGDAILVANAVGDNVTVISPELGVLGTIEVGYYPTKIAVAVDSEEVYVVTRDGISVIPSEDIAALLGATVLAD